MVMAYFCIICSYIKLIQTFHLQCALINYTKIALSIKQFYLIIALWKEQFIQFLLFP